MKVLIISRQERSRSFSTLFDGISLYHEVNVIKLNKEQIRDFFNTVHALNHERYDRVLIDVPLRRISTNYKVLSNITGLILYEEDAYQEYIRNSKYYKKFSKIYKIIGNCKVVVTGYYTHRTLKSHGLDVEVLPKAFDDKHLKDLCMERDIKFAFVGRVKNKIYKPRRSLLDRLQKTQGLQLLRTNPGEEYLQTLNRIKFFLSADINFNEYMAKNFEAMACGCLVFAKKQDIEEAALGLVDMENIVLYSNIKDIEEKLLVLYDTPGLAESIAAKGKELVQQKHSLSARIEPLNAIINSPIVGYENIGYFQRLRSILTR